METENKLQEIRIQISNQISELNNLFESESENLKDSEPSDNQQVNRPNLDK